ncbi:RHS repeat domain-containing protein [Dyella humi]|uniref:RHS repeat protein n=1 Tax=Dyella humi TaxID=1770547 RepID=A0ABW8IFG5_9GAMM
MASQPKRCGTPGAACYQAGDLHTITNANGQVTTIASYDGAGRITRLTDINGVNTDLTYTPRGWQQQKGQVELPLI